MTLIPFLVAPGIGCLATLVLRVADSFCSLVHRQCEMVGEFPAEFSSKSSTTTIDSLNSWERTLRVNVHASKTKKSRRKKLIFNILKNKNNLRLDHEIESLLRGQGKLGFEPSGFLSGLDGHCYSRGKFHEVVGSAGRLEFAGKG